jgi:hypothetical protein
MLPLDLTTIIDTLIRTLPSALLAVARVARGQPGPEDAQVIVEAKEAVQQTGAVLADAHIRRQSDVLLVTVRARDLADLLQAVADHLEAHASELRSMNGRGPHG